MKVAWAICTGILVMGCSGGDEVMQPNCPDIGIPALTVTLLDARSDEPLLVQALVVARDGAYADSTGSAEPVFPTYSLAYNRPGVYTVSVAALGYQPWQGGPFVVNKGQCNVTTIPLAAHLLSQ